MFFLLFLLLTTFFVFVLITVACSFRLKTTTMNPIVAAALLNTKVPGGIVLVMPQTSTDCIMVDSTTLGPTELTGTPFEDFTTHLNVLK